MVRGMCYLVGQQLTRFSNPLQSYHVHVHTAEGRPDPATYSSYPNIHYQIDQAIATLPIIA